MTQKIQQQTIFLMRLVIAVASVMVALSVIKILHQNQIQITQQKQLLDHQNQILTESHKATEAALARIHATEGEQVQISTCQFALLGNNPNSVVTRAQFNACIKDTTFAASASKTVSSIAPGGSSTSTPPASTSTSHRSVPIAALVPPRNSTNPPTKNPTPTAPPEPPGSNPQPTAPVPFMTLPGSALQSGIRAAALAIKLLVE